MVSRPRTTSFEIVASDFVDGHVASHLFGVDLTLSSEDGSRTLAAPFVVVVESRCLKQTPLLSVGLLEAAEDEPSETDGDGNTGPCSSGGGDVMLFALDASSRVVDSSRADEDSPPVIKFSSLSTHAS